MMNVQKYLNDKGSLEGLENDFGILIKRYDDRVVLNYKIDSKPKFDPIVLECRGLILSILPDKKYQVLCRSFDRFFNFGEGDAYKSFDWNNCKVFNKLDGSLINVYHDGEKWCVATRGTAFAEGTNNMGKSFFTLFTEGLGVDPEVAFKDSSRNHTFIFELTSPENRVVTRYNETKVTLLAIRDKTSGLFVDYSMVVPHMMSFNFDCDLVESYNLKNSDDIIKFVESRNQLDEGVVCYDNFTQERIKIKSSSYVAIHRLRGEGENSIKSFVDVVFKHEEDELLVYFPEYTEITMKFKAAYDNMLKYINKLWMETKHIENQKEFALIVKDTNVSGIMFNLKKGLDIYNIIQSLNIDKKVTLLNAFMV